MTTLTDGQRDVATRLAALTGESLEEVVARVGSSGLPERAHLSPTITPILATAFADAGVIDGMPYVTLQNGRTFFGLPSERTHERQHQLLRGLLDPRIPPEGFLCAMDVVHRYVADATVPLDLLPGDGGVIVEVGAFLGHKAVWMMDQSIGTTGRFVAIELLPENCEIMTRNFAVNGFDNTVVVPEGVWHQPGEIEVMGKGRQRNTLVDIDGGRISDPTGYMAPVNPLSDILSRTIPDTAVDFMYLSVNGAEIEALQGLGPWSDRIRALRVASPYTRDGHETSARVRAMLEDLGFELRSTANRNILLGTKECA